MPNEPHATQLSTEELAADLERMRTQQSLLRKSLNQYNSEPPLESYVGQRFRWHDDSNPEVTVTSVTGTGALARVVLGDTVGEVDDMPAAKFRSELAAGIFRPVDSSEVGASLTEHLAAQEPQTWAPELVRGDVPAYVAPEDRNAWLPVAEGSWWVWSAREDKAIVQVLEVDGPSPESGVSIKVPFSVTPQNWKASDFAPGQRFEPIPDLKGQYFMSAAGVAFLVVEIQGEEVLVHDQGAAEPEWDDLSSMLEAIAGKRIRLATPEEAEAWRAETLDEAIAEPIPSRPPVNGDLTSQARDWLGMVNGYQSLEERNAHGVELVGAIAADVGGYTLPEDVRGAKLTNAIAEAFKALLPTKAEVPGRDPVLDATHDEIRAAESKDIEERALARITATACTIEPEQPRRSKRSKLKAEPTPVSSSAPVAIAQSFEEIKASRDAELAEADRLLEESERARQRAHVFAKQLEDSLQEVRARKRAELDELDRLAAELGITA